MRGKLELAPVMAALASGDRFSHYEIVSSLGSGGMGEVYEAIDLTLERRVAIKVLPALHAAREDELRRFTREAKAASSLNHPGIVTIHEIGTAKVEPSGDTLNYISMELVRGSTLRVRLGTTGLAAKLRWLEQTAEALARAHAAGIVHRDLKPENIMITDDGFTKILDFGLAKLADTAASESADTAARSEEITRQGAILGTLGYMSPEQLRGLPLDHRTDVFSFGCILYEAAVGHRPFRGASSVDLAHKIAYEPLEPIDDPAVPDDLQRVVRKALAKDAGDRYQSVQEIAIDLREIRRDLEGTSGGRPPLAARAAKSGWKRPVVAALVAAVVLGIVVIGSALFSKPEQEGGFATMTIERLPDTAGAEEAAISPDGRYVAHVRHDPERSPISIRQMATGSQVVITEAAGGRVSALQFSPDGEYLRFIENDSLREIPVLGGQVRTLLDDVESLVTFSPDGKRAAFVRDSSVFVTDFQGEARRLAVGDGRVYYAEPAWSPLGDAILATRRSLEAAPPRMWIEILDPGGEAASSRRLGELEWWLFSGLRWLADGRSFVVTGAKEFLAERQVWEIDSSNGRPRRITNDLYDYGSSSVSADGRRLVTVQTDKRSGIWRGSVAGGGRLDRILEGAGEIYGTSALPDGGFVYAARAGANIDLWKIQDDGSSRVRLTDDPQVDSNPVVSPRGDLVAFTSTRTGTLSVWTMKPDGSQQRRISQGRWDSIPSFTRDGESIVYASRDTGKRVLWKIPAGGGEAVELAADEIAAREGLVSPDGRWIAARDAGGALVLLDADGRRVRAFNAPFEASAWTPGSDAILYSSGSTLVRQPVDGGASEILVDVFPDKVSSFELLAGGASFICVRTSYQRSVVVITNFR